MKKAGNHEIRVLAALGLRRESMGALAKPFHYHQCGHSALACVQENARLFQRLAKIEDEDSTKIIRPSTSRSTVLSK